MSNAYPAVEVQTGHETHRISRVQHGGEWLVYLMTYPGTDSILILGVFDTEAAAIESQSAITSAVQRVLR
jgi:hypothetical protein